MTYQLRSQLSTKEGWKDGRRGELRNKGWALDGQRGRRDAAEEWMKRGVYIYRGPCGPGWSMGAGAIFFSSFSISPSPPLLKIAFLRGSRRRSSSPLSLLTPPPPQSAALTGRGGGGEGDGRCPLRVRQHFLSVPRSEIGRHQRRAGAGPLSVFVRSICCVQSPLSRPPYRLHWACANWS